MKPAVPVLIEDALAAYAEVTLEERVFLAAHRNIYNGASPVVERAWSLLCGRKRAAHEELLHLGRIALETKNLRELAKRTVYAPNLLERIFGAS